MPAGRTLAVGPGADWTESVRAAVGMSATQTRFGAGGSQTTRSSAKGQYRVTWPCATAFA